MNVSCFDHDDNIDDDDGDDLSVLGIYSPQMTIKIIVIIMCFVTCVDKKLCNIPLLTLICFHLLRRDSSRNKILMSFVTVFTSILPPLDKLQMPMS